MKAVRLIALAAVALITATTEAGSSWAAPKLDWNQTVAVTPEGNHLIGNPNAPAKLVEYVSYTCSHCADFEVEANSQLTLGFIGGGKGSVEYRSFIRNSIDVAASLVVGCGPASKFRANHALFLRQQSKWFHAPSQAEIQRWSSPDFTTAMRAIATDLGFYAMMEPRGYTRQQLDTCLADKAAASRLSSQTKTATEVQGVQGTPSFLLNGVLQDEHGWDGLRPVLLAATR
jgi:protein-disulfide isomerase